MRYAATVLCLLLLCLPLAAQETEPTDAELEDACPNWKGTSSLSTWTRSPTRPRLMSWVRMGRKGSLQTT
jgi:hypothetical protein